MGARQDADLREDGHANARAALGEWQRDLAQRYLAATLVVAAPDDATGLPEALDKPLTSYYLRLVVSDQPGVLAAIAGEFATHGVSIMTVRQDGLHDSAQLVILTHKATEANLHSTVDGLRQLSAVRAVPGVMRVEGA